MDHDPAADDCDSRRVSRRGVWRARPVLAAACGLASVLVPVIAGVASTQVVAGALPRPIGLAATIAYAVLIVITAVGTTVVVERVARELVPLGALYRLTLIFPDRAPARYRVALRARTTRKLELQDRLARAETPDESADVLLQLVAKLSRHDRLTRGHSERVRAYTDLLTEQLSLTDEDAARLRWAALLHDVGKLAVPARILNKPGRLTDDEFAVIMKHPERGAYLAEPLADWLGDWVRSIGEHHERWDGAGYPGGLAGREIALGARIVAVADAFDVMTSFRTYATRRSLPAARRELIACAGSQFDPAVVRAMLQLSLPRLALVSGPLALIASIPLIGRPVAAGLDSFGRSTQSTSTAVGGSEVAVAVAGTVLGAALVLSGIPTVAPDRAEAAAPPAVVGVADVPAERLGPPAPVTLRASGAQRPAAPPEPAPVTVPPTPEATPSPVTESPLAAETPPPPGPELPASPTDEVPVGDLDDVDGLDHLDPHSVEPVVPTPTPLPSLPPSDSFGPTDSGGDESLVPSVPAPPTSPIAPSSPAVPDPLTSAADPLLG